MDDQTMKSTDNQTVQPIILDEPEYDVDIEKLDEEFDAKKRQLLGL